MKTEPTKNELIELVANIIRVAKATSGIPETHFDDLRIDSFGDIQAVFLSRHNWEDDDRVIVDLTDLGKSTEELVERRMQRESDDAAKKVESEAKLAKDLQAAKDKKDREEFARLKEKFGEEN